MPINKRISVTERVDNVERGKRIHPLLRVGSRHLSVFNVILAGNDSGGTTSPAIEKGTHLYHPQLLADLVKAKLVKRMGRRNGYVVYVADPERRGIIPHQVEVTIELFETDKGKFVTKTTLHGRNAVKEGKPVKLLTTRRIKLDVPLPFEPGVEDLVTDVEVDEVPQTIAAKEEPFTIDTTYETIPPK